MNGHGMNFPQRWMAHLESFWGYIGFCLFDKKKTPQIHEKFVPPC